MDRFVAAYIDTDQSINCGGTRRRKSGEVKEPFSRKGNIVKRELTKAERLRLL